MGCNYYLRVIPNKKRKDELCDLIQNSTDFREIINQIQATYGGMEMIWDDGQRVVGGEIHLGKSSYGWKFLFNPNIYEIRQGHMEDDGFGARRYIPDPSTPYQLYDLTKKSIKAFIDRDDMLLYDEYGELQDKDEFWKYAMSTYKKKSNFDAKSYDEYEAKLNSNYRSYSSKNEYVEFLQKLGYNVGYPYNDFYSDGLRFATCLEFS